MAYNLSAAENYALLKEKQFETFLEESFSDEALKGVELFEVPCPTPGLVIKCRKLDRRYSATVQMPMALSSYMITAQNEDLAELTGEARETAEVERFMQMSPIEKRAAIQSTAQMVRYIAVEPRLVVGEVNGHKNAISVGALTNADFNHLAKWASGGDAAQGLKTFRRKRK